MCAVSHAIYGYILPVVEMLYISPQRIPAHIRGVVLGLALRCECSPTVKYPPLETVQQKIDAWKGKEKEGVELARQQVDLASQQLLLAKQQNAPQQLQDTLTQQLNEAQKIQREFQIKKDPNEQLISGLEKQQKELMSKQETLLKKQRQQAKEQIEYELEQKQKRSLSTHPQAMFPHFELTLSEELLVSVLKTSGTYLSGALCIMFDSESQGFPSALARIFRRVRIPLSLSILLC